MTELQSKIDEIAANFPIGKAGAVKRGRNPHWPYIAVLKDYLGTEGSTHNPFGRVAFATREEALARVDQHIAKWRAIFRDHLMNPRFRGLRSQHGLPVEITPDMLGLDP